MTMDKDYLRYAIDVLGDISSSLEEHIDPYRTTISQEFLTKIYKKNSKNVVKFFSIDQELNPIAIEFIQLVKNNFENYERSTRLLVYQKLDYSRGEIKKLVDSNDRNWMNDINLLEPSLLEERKKSISTLTLYGIIKSNEYKLDFLKISRN